MLPLTEIQQGHNSRFLILRGIAFENLGDKFLVDGIKLEGNRWIVVVSITMLKTNRLVAE